MNRRAIKGFSARAGTRLFIDYRSWLAWCRLVVLGLICASCCGCSRRTYWYHPGRTFAEAERDCYECHRQAQVEAAEAAWDQRIDRSQVQGESTDQQWSYAYQDVQFRRCMRRRGYHLTPQRELKAPLRKHVLRMGDMHSYPVAGN